MTSPVERTIFGYWHQGRDAAPDAVKRCWALWMRMNPGWRLDILEWEDVKDRFSELRVDGEAMSLNGVANIVRIDRLAEEGGVWVDACTVPLQPLDDWLPPLAADGFFAYHDPQRKRMAGNWFIAARAGHPLAVAWRDRMVAYWQTPRRQMRSVHELDRGLRGALARLSGRLRDRLRGPVPSRGTKHIHQPKDPLWAVSAPGGGRFGIYPYFAMANLFDLMIAEDAALWREFAKYPKRAPHDCLMLRHWKKSYEILQPSEMASFAHGRPMLKLAPKTPLPEPLMQALVVLSEAAMPQTRS